MTKILKDSDRSELCVVFLAELHKLCLKYSVQIEPEMNVRMTITSSNSKIAMNKEIYEEFIKSAYELSDD